MPDQPSQSWPDCSPKSAPAVTFEQLMPKEREQIQNARKQRLPGITTEPVQDSSIGLAFSGGGIRSATFNLGILQSLAEHDLLRRFDYLSTVSGGGYIGAWFAAFTKRYLETVPQDAAGNKPTFKDAQDALIPRTFEPGKRTQPAFLFWLRQYSNYLTPNSGLITGDTWAAVGTWLRNVFLNQTILGLVFVGGLLLCHDLLMLLVNSHYYTLEVAAGVLLMFVAAACMGLNVVEQVSCAELLETKAQRVKISISVMLPFVVSCVLLNSGLWRWNKFDGMHLWQSAVAGAVFYFLVWLVAVAAVKSQNLWRTLKEEGREQGWRWQLLKLKFLFVPEPQTMISRGALVGYAPIAGAAGAILLHEYINAVKRLPLSWPGMPWMVIAFGSGVVMLILLVAGSLHLGLIGRGSRDLVREWWARLGGYLMLITMAWVLLAATSALGPLLVRWVFFKLGRWKSISAIALWIAHNYLGLKSASSPKTTGTTEKRTDQNDPDPKVKVMKFLDSRHVLDAIATAAPYVFAAGMFLILSTVVHFGTGLAVDYTNTRAFWHQSDHWSGVCTRLDGAASSSAFFCDRYWYIQCGQWWAGHHGNLESWLVLIGVLLCAAGVGLSLRVDVNDFSLHHFYRNRLVRCYLGASNPHRRPQPFTGFDPADDVALNDFAGDYPGPYPIFNTALNITTGEELGYATRRAKSFVFTPRYCGYDLGSPTWGPLQFLPEDRGTPSYCQTHCGRSEKGLGAMTSQDGIALGTAMAISGAAASPNMGYYTTPATAFFMTLFDVRLGWWIGNPRWQDQWLEPGPKWGLAYLFSELFAKSDQRRSFVYLSDGGHFENLAVYELIKRRCKVIVACDADCDLEYKFENLLGLIAKARTDFGARIEIDFASLRPIDGQESADNCVAGKIYYKRLKPDSGEEEDPATFILIKTSMPLWNAVEQNAEHCGKRLPDDVRRYGEKHPTFPHQSTADQWFDEDQFESYRALGEFIGHRAKTMIQDAIGAALKEHKEQEPKGAAA